MMDEEKTWVHNWLDAVRINGGTAANGFPAGNNDESFEDADFDDSLDSSSGESDHEYDDYLYQMAGDFRRRTHNSDTLSPPPIKSTEKKPDKPDWFIDRPFQYHGRVCMVALPGLVIALLLGGEMLVFIVCICGLVIYLLHTSGYQESSLTVYTASSVFLTAFICLTAFPLVWTSAYHFVLVIGLTIHTALTGAWLLLLFPSYTRENPKTAVYIEYLLFSVYPFMSVILVLWLSAMISSVFISSYALIGCSYVVLQNFLQPTPSSFAKPVRKEKDYAYIITTSESVALSVTYSLLPSFIVIMGIAYKKQLILSTGVELLFITSVCGFVCVVTTAEYLSELYHVSQSCVWVTKVSCMFMAVVTLPAVLQNHGWHSSLSLYVPIALLGHAAFGYVVIQRKGHNQTLVFILGGVVLAIYTLFFIRLPWTVQLYISGGLDVRLLFVLVYISMVLSVECVLGYVLFDAEELGLCMFVHTVGVMSTQAISLFVEYAGLLCLLFVLSRYVLVVEDHIVTTKQVLSKVVSVGVIAVLNMPLWVNRLLLIVLRREASYIDYFCSVVVIEALLCLYLSSKNGLKRLQQCSVGLLLIAAAIALVHPSLTLSWDSVVKWMVLSCILLVVLLTQITRYLSKSLMLSVVFSALIGLPLGISLSSLLFPMPEVLHHVFVSFLCVTLILLAMLVWLGRTDMENSSYKCLWLVVVELVAGISLQVALGYKDDYLSAVLLMMSVSTVAGIFKLHSLRKETLRLTPEGDLKVSRLPLIGNGCTLAAFIFSFYFSPLSYWNWGFVSSLLLFLLQEDHIVLRSALRDNNIVPTVFTLSGVLVLSTGYHSSTWTRGEWPYMISGVLEICVTVLTLPVFIDLWTVLWNDQFYLSDYYVVLVAPLFSILLLTGSSVYAYCLCGVGLCTGYWLLTEKLPLIR